MSENIGLCSFCVWIASLSLFPSSGYLLACFIIPFTFTAEWNLIVQRCHVCITWQESRMSPCVTTVSRAAIDMDEHASHAHASVWGSRAFGCTCWSGTTRSTSMGGGGSLELVLKYIILWKNLTNREISKYTNAKYTNGILVTSYYLLIYAYSQSKYIASETGNKNSDPPPITYLDQFI